MITVHHLGVSQSERIAWLCEELGLTYRLIRYDRDPDTRLAPVPYKSLHPMGIAPVITDGDVVLAESGAIIEYIIGKYGDGRLTVSSESPSFPDYLFWFHFANATMIPSGTAALIASLLASNGEEPIVRALESRGDRAYDMAEARLGEVPYFAGGQFTAADIMMLFPLTTMRAFTPRDLTPFPHIRGYLNRIGQRPAYQRAMAIGDPDMTPMLT